MTVRRRVTRIAKAGLAGVGGGVGVLIGRALTGDSPVGGALGGALAGAVIGGESGDIIAVTAAMDGVISAGL